MALIIPEVFSNMVREKFTGKAKFLNIAKDLGELNMDFHSVGDTINFPKWKLIGNAEEVTKGTAITTEDLAQVESSATIKQIAKGVRVYDMDNLTSLGNALDEGAMQMALVMARKFDDDLIKEALTSPLKCKTAGATFVTTEELNKAVGLFGDEQDTEDMECIIINSRLALSFYSMTEFVSNQLTHTTDNNGIVRAGCIGYYRGIAVVMSDKGTYDTTKNECITFIIKKNSLGFKEKRGIFIEEERKASLKCSELYGDYIYAVKLINDAGVVILRNTIA